MSAMKERKRQLEELRVVVERPRQPKTEERDEVVRRSTEIGAIVGDEIGSSVGDPR